jgi:hypothetical protein
MASGNQWIEKEKERKKVISHLLHFINVNSWIKRQIESYKKDNYFSVISFPGGLWPHRNRKVEMK